MNKHSSYIQLRTHYYARLFLNNRLFNQELQFKMGYNAN
jgi:hypothetical protein